MSSLSWLWSFRLMGPGIAFVALSSVAIATYELGTWPWPDRRPLRERYLFTEVRRAELRPILKAPGRLDSSKKNVVRCELENIVGSAAAASAGGASTVISLLPEGTEVKQGDVLARLDASTYEELARQQSIVVEQAKASQLQARLNLDIALLAVRQYREGTVHETVQGFEGAIALARSDLSRATARLGWTKHMNEKGYASLASISTDRDTVSRLEISLQRQVASLNLFQRFTLRKTEKSLQAQVKSAETTLANENLRLQRQLERLALLQKQVERCTIRAPGGGVLFYYKQERRTQLIEEGMAVRQNQPLFYLPDMSEMEILTALNESVVDRVSPGLRARVAFEALPQLTLAGSVVTISQIPVQQSDRGEDIHYFFCTVKLDSVSPNLRPGMTAKVDIALSPRHNVLAIPHQAVRSDRGKKVCYVAQAEQLVRREVKIGQGTTDFLEVDGGLTEGEYVALNPPAPAVHLEPLLNFGEVRDVPTPDADSVVSTHH